MSTDPTNNRDLDYMQRYLVEEMVEDYRENRISRRELLRRVLLITGSVPLAATTLAACAGGQAPAGQPTSAPAGSPSPARAAASPAGSPVAKASPATAGSPAAKASPGTAAVGSPAAPSPSPATNPVTVSPTDPAIEVAAVEFPGQAGTIKGYRAQPRGAARAPGIIVIHENRGLNEHIKDVARRYAKSGYLAVAVDLLSRRGGTESFADPTQAGSALGQISQTDMVQDLVSGVAYLKGLPNFAGPKAGVVGYCFGGGMTWLLAIASPDIGAAVPYYGPIPQPVDEVQKITGAVLAFYGENDRFVNPGIPTVEEAMRRYNKTFEYRIYPGAGHAFNNDTGNTYNAAAAADAYQRSLDWFARYLQA